MKSHFTGLILLVLTIFSSPAFTRYAGHPITFKTGELHFGKTSVKVEIADNPEKASQGLMFRKSLPEGHGMLFIFEGEEPRAFWMKNTFVDLSIGFFDKTKKLVDVQDMQAVKSEMQTNIPTYQSKSPSQYALEVPKGWFQKHKIKIGDHFTGP